jgi:hypothetical protein
LGCELRRLEGRDELSGFDFAAFVDEQAVDSSLNSGRDDNVGGVDQPNEHQRLVTPANNHRRDNPGHAEDRDYQHCSPLCCQFQSGGGNRLRKSGAADIIKMTLTPLKYTA